MELILPLTGKEVKNYEAIDDILSSMPSQVKSVQVDRTDDFFGGETTSVNIQGNDGEKLSFEIVDGEIKK